MSRRVFHKLENQLIGTENTVQDGILEIQEFACRTVCRSRCPRAVIFYSRNSVYKPSNCLAPSATYCTASAASSTPSTREITFTPVTPITPTMRLESLSAM